jgi:pimeloyl-ACP methyl ester carboxylesterase
MHKKAPGLVATALHSVTTYGFTVAAIDAPGHGDRPRSRQDQRWVEAIHQARASREPIAPIVIDYSMSLAQRAAPEWQATLDALQALPEIGVEAAIGYGGVTLGVVTGLMLTANDPRITAASFGAVFVNDSLIEAARGITIPVECRIPWDNTDFDRASGLALFDAFSSTEKTLHAHSGKDYTVPAYERDSSAKFFVRHLVHGRLPMEHMRPRTPKMG